MLINKELYREFDFERLIFMSLAKLGDALAAASEGEEAIGEQGEAAEEKKKDIKDKSEEIWKARIGVRKKMEKIVKSANKGSTEYKEAAKDFAAKLLAHAEKRFDEISEQYDEARAGGKYLEERPKLKKLDAQATKLLNDIKERLKTKKDVKKYLKHIVRQNKLKEAGDEPEKEKELSKGLKKQIITEHLIKIKELDKVMARFLAGIIVEGDMDIDLKHGDLDEDNIELFFENVNKYQEHVGDKLKDILNDVVDAFLEQAPNPEATDDEMEMIEEWITEDETLKDHYGDEGPHLEGAVNTMAKKFDIRFDDSGNVLYGTDLLTDSAYPGEGIRPGGKEFKKGIASLKDAILWALNPNRKPASDITNFDKLEDYNEEVDDHLRPFKKLRKEIDENVVGLWEGDEITEWDDWPGHSAVIKLMNAGWNTRKYVRKFKRHLERKEAVKREEVAKEDLKKGLRGVLTKAGLFPVSDPKVKKRFEGFDVEVDGPNLKGSKNTRIRFDCRNEKKGETITITVNYNKPGDANIKLQMKAEKTDDYQGFSESIQYKDLAEFKKIDMATVVGETAKRIDTNRQLWHGFTVDLLSAGNRIEGLDITYPSHSPKDYIDPAYKPPVGKLIMEGKQVGFITFLPKDGKKINKDHAVIHINGEKTTLPLDQLKKELPKKMEDMRKVAKRAEEITKQAKEGLDKLETKLEGLTVAPIVPPEGNFGDPEGQIKIADFNKTDKDTTLAATLFIRVNKPKEAIGEPKRKYILVDTTDNKEQEFDSIDKVNDYLKANQKELALVKEEPKPAAKLSPEMEKFKKKVIAYAKKIYGERMGKIDPNDPRFNIALNKFVRGLPKDRAKKLLEKGDKPAKKELVKLCKAFFEAYGLDTLEAVDKKEVKMITEMNVEVKGKTKKFKDVFGKELAATVAATLSMSQEFKQGKKDVLVKKGDRFYPVTAEGLADYLPTNMQDGYLKVLKGEAKPEELKDFKKTAEDVKKGREALKKFAKQQRNPNRTPELKQMGFVEVIASIGQLYRIFQEAMETGDPAAWKTLRDAFEDFNNSISPAEGMRTAKETYEKTINGKPGIQDTGELLELYSEPYGVKAKKLFTVKGKSERYRYQLKTVIEERFATALNVDIEDMEVKGNKTNIIAYKGSQKYKIYLNRDGNETFASMEEMTMTEGNNPRETVNEAKSKPSKKIENIDTGSNSLAEHLFNKKPLEARKAAKKKAAAKKAAERALPNKGVKDGFFTKGPKGETILNAKAGASDILKILKSEVTQVTIKLGKKRQDLDAGKTVTVSKADGFALKEGPKKGQRLYIFEGDVIVSSKATTAKSKTKKAPDANKSKPKANQAEQEVKKAAEQKIATDNYDDGNLKIIDNNDYASALKNFQIADRIRPHKRPKWLIAICHDQIGNHEKVRKAYENYIGAGVDQVKDKTNIDYAKKRITELKENNKSRPSTTPPGFPLKIRTQERLAAAKQRAAAKKNVA